MKNARKIARILRRDKRWWQNCRPDHRIRVAENDMDMYASTCEYRTDYLDYTHAWFKDAHEANMFIIKHLGLSA